MIYLYIMLFDLIYCFINRLSYSRDQFILVLVLVFVHLLVFVFVFVLVFVSVLVSVLVSILVLARISNFDWLFDFFSRLVIWKLFSYFSNQKNHEWWKIFFYLMSQMNDFYLWSFWNFLLKERNREKILRMIQRHWMFEILQIILSLNLFSSLNFSWSNFLSSSTFFSCL